MAKNPFEPTKAQLMAQMVLGNVNQALHSAAVQRSHRFPYHVMVQIENLAEIGQVPVSVIINDLLECGLEVVTKALPEEVAAKLNISSREQRERPMVTIRTEVKKRNTAAKPKLKVAK